MDIIKELPSEAQQLIPSYRVKWEAAALSTEPIDYGNIKSAIQELYLEMGYIPDYYFYGRSEAHIKQGI